MAAEREVKFKQIIDPVLAKALTHPLRGHILLVFGERGVASPKEVGTEIGVAVTDVSYHVRKLKAKGLLRLVRTEQRRGVREHFYELTEPLVYFDDREWKRLPKQIQSRLGASLLRVMMTDVVDALRVGTFSAGESHQSRLAMPVDEQGQRDAAEVLSNALERLLEIQRECAERMTLPSEDSIPLVVLMLGFEAARGKD